MIDIIIPHYGDGRLLARCLAAIEANTPEDHRVMVVDNNAENRGFAAACNEGIRATDGDYVVLLNNDTEVPPGWAERLTGIAEMDAKIAAVGPLSTAATQWQWVHNMARQLEINLPTPDYITSDVTRFPSQLAFWCVLIPRRVLDDVGLLDEQFFMYAEDDDWCIRAQQAGYKLALDLSTVVTHHHRKNYSDEAQAHHLDSLAKLKAKYAEAIIEDPSVYVAVLNQGTLRVELANMLAHTMRQQPGISNIALGFPNSKPIADNRNRIVLDFLTDFKGAKVLAAFAEGAPMAEALAAHASDSWDYLIMIDDDVVPYRNPLELVPLMEKHQLDILGLPTPIVQYRKSPEKPIFWNAMLYVEDHEPEPWCPINLAGDQGLIEVDAIGTGCIIIHRRVLEHPDLTAPFARMFNAFGVAVRGLDLWFCEKAKAAGYKIWTHTEYPCEHWYDLPMARLAGMIQDTPPSRNGKDEVHVDQDHQPGHAEALVRLDG